MSERKMLIFEITFNGCSHNNYNKNFISQNRTLMNTTYNNQTKYYEYAHIESDQKKRHNYFVSITKNNYIFIMLKGIRVM